MNETVMNLREVIENEGVENHVLTTKGLESYLKRAESLYSFAHSKTLPTLSFGNFYDVPILNVLDELYNACITDKLDEIFERTAGTTWTEGVSDNSYNWNANVSRHFMFTEYINNELEYAVVFLSVHTGLDVRAGYTNPVAFLFETSGGDNYDFLEALSNARGEYSVGVKATMDGKEWDGYFALDTEAISEEVRYYMSLSCGDEWKTLDDYEFSDIEPWDKEVLEKSLYTDLERLGFTNIKLEM